MGQPILNDVRRPALPPLVVDLDGTLLKTDLLYEKFVRLLFEKLWLLFLLPFWLLRGKAVFKRELAQRITLDVYSLPVNAPFLAWLQAEKARGRTLALVSASDRYMVAAVAKRFGDLFDIVEGSDGATNLAGSRKLDLIKNRLGEDFSYAGDERRDLVIWEHCRSAVLVGRGCGLKPRLPPGVEVSANSRCRPSTSPRGCGRCACSSGPRTRSSSCRCC